MNIKNDIHWETFLENYFTRYRPIVHKNEYKSGLTLNFEMGDVYVWCDLDHLKLKIKKLEFGRRVNLNEVVKDPNWVKGIFRNNAEQHVEFLQTSFEGEASKFYEIPFNDEGRQAVSKFLEIPTKTGWTEEEYLIEPDRYYKVAVLLDHLKWTITLKDIGEQDLPMLGDSLNQWLRVKLSDAFWNNSKRIIKRFVVIPKPDKK